MRKNNKAKVGRPVPTPTERRDRFARKVMRRGGTVLDSGTDDAGVPFLEWLDSWGRKCARDFFPFTPDEDGSIKKLDRNPRYGDPLPDKLPLICGEFPLRATEHQSFIPALQAVRDLRLETGDRTYQIWWCTGGDPEHAPDDWAISGENTDVFHWRAPTKKKRGHFSP